MFANNNEATLKSFGIKSKGAEVYLFISKGADMADDGTEDDQQKNQYQQQIQQCPYNQSPPKQHYDQQPQGQYGMNQPYSYQRQHSYPQAQNNYNQSGIQSLPPPEPIQHHYTGNAGPQMSPGVRGKPIKINDNHPQAFIPEPLVKEPEKPVRPPTPPKIGWPCPSCTVINEPYRPGCEVCGTARPDDYKPPADYKPTEEEERFLQEDKGLEQVKLYYTHAENIYACFMMQLFTHAYIYTFH